MIASQARLTVSRTALLFPFFLLFSAGCLSDDPSAPEDPSLSSLRQTVWVAIEPRQCLTNPWEQDWLQQSGGAYEDYPKDPMRPGLEPEELEIIQDYYARLGVVVSDGTTRKKYEVVCMACSCPEGHTLYLQVRPQDVRTMVAFGYRVEAPAVSRDS